MTFLLDYMQWTLAIWKSHKARLKMLKLTEHSKKVQVTPQGAAAAAMSLFMSLGSV